MLTLLERQIIFGDLLEDIKDIAVLNEVQNNKSTIESNRTSSSEEAINTSAKTRETATKINDAKRKIKAEEERADTGATHVKNQEARIEAQNSRTKVMGIDFKNKRIQQERDRGTPQDPSANTATAASSLTDSVIYENDNIDTRISADKRAEKRAYKNLKWSKFDRGNLDAYNKSQSRNFDTRNNVVMKQFDTMLFKGTGGLALKKMLGQQLTDSEEENIECRVVAEVMSSDTVSKTIVNNIKMILNKFKSGTAKDEDRTRLAMFRSQFKIQYQKMKEIYNEKVGE